VVAAEVTLSSQVVVVTRRLMMAVAAGVVLDKVVL